MIHSQKGTVMISFVIAVPLLLMLLMSFFWLTGFISLKQQSENICHRSLLQAQMARLQSHDQVLALNPQALALIKEKKALNLILRTGPMKARALAKLRKKQVVAKQKVLRKKQQALFLSGEALSNQYFFQGQKQLTDFLNSRSRFWQKGQKTSSLRWQKRLPRSRLRQGVRDVAPTYERKSGYSQRQSLDLTWSQDIKDLAPPWFQALIPQKSLWQGRWVASCSTHPRKGDKKWYANIGKGRAL